MVLENERTAQGVATTDLNTGCSVKVPNMVYDETERWQKQPPHSQPMLEVSVKTDPSNYGHPDSNL